VALGLCRYQPATGMLLETATDRGDDTLAGYACLGLAMIGDAQAAPVVRDVAAHAARRPLLLQQAAIALVLLGDRSVTDQLIGMLGDQDTNLARLAAVAKALGLVGDRRSLPRLAAAAHDAGLTALARAFALAALGDIADPRLLPWNTPYAVGVNYRAAAETLRDGTAGVLDIL
jgi:HEAT repeat protein